MPKEIVTIPYSKVQFKWVSYHWDLHLSGICIYNNEICEFKTIEGDWDDESGEWEESFCRIFKLTWKEKFDWWLRQRFFETCVGYHWTFPHRKKGGCFYYRNPKWLYKLLFKLFYKIKINSTTIKQ